MKDFDIKVELTKDKKEKPAFDQLSFGTNFTDHMFVMDYTKGQGWHDPRIIPYQPITLDPAAIVFHYGQTVFEGLKAYRTKDEEILLFRPDQNMKRLNRSNERLCIPVFDEELALAGLKKLISIDKDWVPNVEGTSLYIRPFIFATEPYLGVAASDTYRFLIILSPVGAYYKEGINPVKIAVEQEYVRAVTGGTGNAKTAGNYAGSLKAQVVADAAGYSQVLWLDGKEKKYIEEVGSMNVFFKINGEVITPVLNGSILEGITRKSVIELLNHWDIPVVERKISIDEIFRAYQEGVLEEAFGTGTAAVISPIGELFWQGEKLVINNGETGAISKKVYDSLTGIQTGTKEDPFGWRVKVE
ncbi:branched-chain amino acid aminotransferase [Lederbergia citrea]|uniref:Branched-chain-amino-acid aminotransferase n=1 Tax=Lederbergia citrea TaxID=2833581 RepID=A0A942UN53_9BACI|nr:branched-chain amino acid aminotransferase [Lederbergia citrea]MBS4176801.1 branched-chain amino acid aminotransferase [Lederbergia citrea]MBS4203361.1 branched-chain amino acid aminotransferase [Lederbergia citrea]MBS4221966.1 branched-chain amino acid aminotransferase [Lederbergia citrea]